MPARKRTKKKPRQPAARRASRPSTPLGRDVSGIVLLTLALMGAAAILSFHPEDPPGGNASSVQNLLGPAGAWAAYSLVNFTFGRWLSLVIPLLFAFAGFDLLRGRGMVVLKKTVLPLIVFTTLAASIVGVVRTVKGLEHSLEVNGFIGWGLDSLLQNYIGFAGTVIVLAGVSLIYITLLFRIRWGEVFAWMKQALIAAVSFLSDVRIPIRRPKKAALTPSSVIKPKKRAVKADPEPEPAEDNGFEDAVLHADEPPAIITNNGPKKGAAAPTSAKKTTASQENKPSEYLLPPLDLFEEPTEEENVEVEEKVLRETAKTLEDRLAEFGVQASVVAIHPGPVITRYDLKPAPGVKVSRITSLGDDLALSLSSNSVRIIAPIPGAGAVGVEVPNPGQGTVRLREILAGPEFQKASSPLAIALGKTAQGDNFVVDLAKMPHVLIAGTTGSGKSVCINTIIASLLMKNRPHEVMIAMVDPKKIELSAYAELRRHHLLFLEETDEVIATEPKNAVMLLQSVVHEMEKRYDRLAETGARNLVEFNRLVEKGKVQPDEDGNEPKPLPYIVTIIDELADLMLTAARDVEEPIARLAQMARAVGIHLVVATQRPSVDVITGVIKANFPARIAFMVATKIDSRTILDRPGAESLLGRGDGLYLAGTSPQPIRFHGAFVSTDEVHNLIAHVHNQPMFVKSVTLATPESGGNGNGGVDVDEERDALFAEAVRTVARHQQGSVSLLQRRLKIGYSRAGRLLDQLEQAGIVGPFEGSKARDVLIDADQVEAFLQGGSED